MKPNNKISHTDVLWHPNFRVVATLPDTKVIRTSFLVNFTTLGLVLGAGAVLFLREQELAEVRTQTLALVSLIEADAPKEAQAIKLQKEFSDTEKRFKEVDGFRASNFVATRFLRRLAETLPRFFTIDVVESTESVTRLRGTVVGSPGKATDIAKDYVNQLAEDPAFSQLVQSVKLSTINRDSGANRMIFEIEIRMKPLK